MKVVSVLEKDGWQMEEEYDSLDEATSFCHAFFNSEDGPFVLTIYQHRHFRGDLQPSRECIAIWRRIKESRADARSPPEDRSQSGA